MSDVQERLLRLLDTHRVLTTGQLRQSPRRRNGPPNIGWRCWRSGGWWAKYGHHEDRERIRGHWWLTTAGARLITGTACAEGRIRCSSATPPAPVNRGPRRERSSQPPLLLTPVTFTLIPGSRTVSRLQLTNEPQQTHRRSAEPGRVVPRLRNAGKSPHFRDTCAGVCHQTAVLEALPSGASFDLGHSL